ncbi:MAG: hypothetical protein WDN28_18085 [Chthoniobacter sp.]
MEGIVRQTWKADPKCDIVFVYTVTEALVGPMLEGKYPRAASAMEKVAEHYHIPSIPHGHRSREAGQGRQARLEGAPAQDGRREGRARRQIRLLGG